MNKFLSQDEAGLNEDQVLELINKNAVTYTNGVVNINDNLGNLLYSMPTTAGIPNYIMTCNPSGNMIFNNTATLNVLQTNTLKFGNNWTFPLSGTAGQVLGLSNNITPVLQWQDSGASAIAALQLVTQNQSSFSTSGTYFSGALFVQKTINSIGFYVNTSIGYMTNTNTVTGASLSPMLNYSDANQGTFTLPANTVAHASYIQFVSYGDVSSNGNNTLIVRAQFNGSSVLLAHTLTNFNSGGVSFPFEMTTTIRFFQNVVGVVNKGFISSKFVTYNNNSIYMMDIQNIGTIAFDPTIANQFYPSVQWTVTTSQVVNIYTAILTGMIIQY